MKKRINDKIEEIESYIGTLTEIIPEELEIYLASEEKRWSCERGFERIAESLVDLSIFIIKDKGFISPEEDDTSFLILLKNNIISDNTFRKMSDIKGMRNRLAHRYGEIDNEIVFDAIRYKLELDVSKFLEEIKKNGGY